MIELDWSGIESRLRSGGFHTHELGWLDGAITLDWRCAELRDDIHAVNNLAKCRVLVIEMLTLFARQTDKELTSR